MKRSGINSAILLKKDLIVNQYSMKNIYKLKLSLTKKTNTNFHDDRILKEGCHCVWLSVVLTDSVFKMGRI